MFFRGPELMYHSLPRTDFASTGTPHSLIPNNIAGAMQFFQSWNERATLQTDPVAAASMARKMMGPAPFCSWLMPGLVLMSSYIHSEVDHISLHVW